MSLSIEVIYKDYNLPSSNKEFAYKLVPRVIVQMWYWKTYLYKVSRLTKGHMGALSGYSDSRGSTSLAEHW